MNYYDYQRNPELAIMNDLPENQRALFLAHYNSVRKDEFIGALLAFFLGHFGIHRFYMGEIGWGLLYLAFCWTGIPTILGFIECFFMPGRVRRYNLNQAMFIAAHMRTVPYAPANGMMPLAAL